MLTHNHGWQEDVVAVSFPSGHIARVFSSAARREAAAELHGRRGPGDGRRYGAPQQIYAPVIGKRLRRLLCAAAEPACCCGTARFCQRPVSATTVHVFSHAAGHAWVGSPLYLWSELADVYVLQRWCVRGSSIFLGFRRVLDGSCCHHAPDCGLREPPSKTAREAWSMRLKDTSLTVSK